MRMISVAMLLWATCAAGAPAETQLTLPKSGIVRVAFVVSDRATLIDIAGPMQVFDQVQSPGTTGFQTFTVSETRKPIKAGTMTIVPDYSFADAPEADIVVVGAQSGKYAALPRLSANDDGSRPVDAVSVYGGVEIRAGWHP